MRRAAEDSECTQCPRSVTFSSRPGETGPLRTRRQEVLRHHRPPLEVSQGGMREGEARAGLTGMDGEERRKVRQA